MIFDRLKNVLRANISAKLDELQGTDYDLWKTFFEKDEHDDDFYKEENFKQAEEEWERTKNQYQQASNSEKQKEAGYYADLELKPGASFKEIKSQYRKMVKMYHPDLFQHDPKKKQMADEVTRKINEAYNYFEKKFGK